jgi:hypothetical protein
MKKLFHSLPEFSFSNIEILLTLIFGLIAGVLTIVGLLSIFISINSQHNIQKCREIYWKLMRSNERGPLLEEFILYHDILKDNERFTTKVVNIILVTIGVVVVFTCLLTIILCVIKFTFWEIVLAGLVTVCISGIFIRFSFVLNDLKKVQKISSLPGVENLLDANYFTRVNTISLMAQTVGFHYRKFIFPNQKDEIHINIYIGTPLPFHNAKVTIDEIAVSSEGYMLEGWVHSNHQKLIFETDDGLDEYNTRTNRIKELVLLNEGTEITNDDYNRIINDVDEVSTILTVCIPYVDEMIYMSFMVQVEGQQGTLIYYFEDIEIKTNKKEDVEEGEILPTTHELMVFSSEEEYKQYKEKKEKHSQELTRSLPDMQIITDGKGNVIEKREINTNPKEIVIDHFEYQKVPLGKKVLFKEKDVEELIHQQLGT